MANDINITVSATENASDALGDVQDAATRTSRVVVNTMGDSEDAFDTAVRSSGAYGQALDKVSGTAQALGDGLSSLGDTLSAVTDLQTRSAQRAREQQQHLIDIDQAAQDTAQSLQDLKQAEQDLTQSQIDADQAQADYQQALNDGKQATIDIALAQKAYTDAVRQHGAGSTEAKQAEVDLLNAKQESTQADIDAKQAQADLTQAQLDGNQAKNDANQANIDTRQSQLDLNQAMADAHPPATKAWAEDLGLASQMIMGVVGVVELLKVAQTSLTLATIKNTAATIADKAATVASSVASGVATAAQWAWNIAVNAFPVMLIITAIIAIIAVIIYLATKTQFFQTIWRVCWGAIKEAAEAVWNWLKSAWSNTIEALGTAVEWVKEKITAAFRFAVDFVVGYFKFIFSIPGKIASAFAVVGNAIAAPFKAAFNAVARFWNSTVGRLSWTVPGWIPGIGGHSISAPKLPQLAFGGEVLRTGAAIIHAGEQIGPAQVTGRYNTNNGGKAQAEVTFGGNTDTAMATAIMKLIRTGQIVITVG